MLYEAEQGNILMAITGESLITQGLSMFREERFLGLRDLLLSADVRFTNLEVLLNNYEDSPAYLSGGTYMRCDPRFAKDLEWLGLNLIACANNHAFDFGENGVLTNIRYLDEAGLVHSGTGRHLAEATAPGYLNTPNGRVALVSATSPTGGVSIMARAGEQRRDFIGRPGANVIDFTTEWTVDSQAFDELRRLSNELGWAEQVRRSGESGYQSQIQDTDSLVHLLTNVVGEASPARFVLGDSFERHTYIDEADLERNVQWVADARRMADWVLFTIHTHEGGKTLADPADHIRVLAHAVIDAGADMFIGHGPHEDRGIEIYKGRPIFYSLGDFICQNDSVLFQPQDNYLRQGLGWEATPADFFDARSANGTRGQVVEAIRWESAVAMTRFDGRQLKEIRLHPVDLGFQRPPYQQGRPLLAEGEVSERVLERFQKRSQPFGTEIKIEDNVGLIQV